MTRNEMLAGMTTEERRAWDESIAAARELLEGRRDEVKRQRERRVLTVTDSTGKRTCGGWGQSGNPRPAAAFATDFCAYPVANMIETADDLPVPTGVQWKNEWIS